MAGNSVRSVLRSALTLPSSCALASVSFARLIKLIAQPPHSRSSAIVRSSVDCRADQADMYRGMGNAWATGLLAFLSAACVVRAG